MSRPTHKARTKSDFERKGPKNKKNTIMRLIAYFKTRKLHFFTVVFCMIIATLLGLFTPYAIGKGIDYITTGNVKSLIVLIGILIGVYVTQELLNWFQIFQMGKLSQGVIFEIRNDTFSKLHKLPISYFHKKPFGELMSRLTNDVENINNTLSQFFTQFIVSIVTMVGATTIMLNLNVTLTITCFVTVPLVLFLTKIISKKSKELFRKQSKQLGILNGYMEEAISNIEIIKSFHQEKSVINNLEDKNVSFYEVGRKAQIWSGYLMPILNVINNLGYTAIVLVGGILIVQGNGAITVGIIASFITYSKLFTRPINELSSMYNMLQAALAGAERIFEIMDTKEEDDQIPRSNPPIKINGSVEFDNVTFSYNGSKKNLENVSFEIDSGTKVALVGPTGAGKTTVTTLLTRMYDVEDGAIMVDNQDIRKYSLEDVRNFISTVLQDAYLFHGTIEENIRYGKIDATKEEIIAAAQMANADAFISKLPQGYDTIVTENGSNVSQGERQLISIARSILQNPSILILDEATNNVDTLTEKKIQEALWKFMDNRTTFIIAHRLDTILQADLILVVSDGKISEQGTHDQLLRQKGSYYKLFQNYTNKSAVATDINF